MEYTLKSYNDSRKFVFSFVDLIFFPIGWNLASFFWSGELASLFCFFVASNGMMGQTNALPAAIICFTLINSIDFFHTFVVASDPHKKMLMVCIFPPLYDYLFYQIYHDIWLIPEENSADFVYAMMLWRLSKPIHVHFAPRHRQTRSNGFNLNVRHKQNDDSHICRIEVDSFLAFVCRVICVQQEHSIFFSRCQPSIASTPVRICKLVALNVRLSGRQIILIIKNGVKRMRAEVRLISFIVLIKYRYYRSIQIYTLFDDDILSGSTLLFRSWSTFTQHSTDYLSPFETMLTAATQLAWAPSLIRLYSTKFTLDLILPINQYMHLIVIVKHNLNLRTSNRINLKWKPTHTHTHYFNKEFIRKQLDDCFSW